MNRSPALWAIVAVSVLTGLVSLWRGDRMLAWYPVPLQGIAGRIAISIAFTIAAVIFGLVAQSVYGRMLVNRPDAAAQTYLWIGAGAALVLSVAAVVVYAILKRGPIVAWILLNILWGIGYGWGLPALLAR